MFSFLFRFNVFTNSELSKKLIFETESQHVVKRAELFENSKFEQHEDVGEKFN